MKLAINAGVIKKNHISGVGTFAINICKEICKLHKDTMVWATDQGVFNNIDINLIKSENLFYRAFWDQFIFPRLIYGKADAVFFPVQEGILYPKIPQIVFLHDISIVHWQKHHPFLRVLSFNTRVKIALSNSKAILVPSLSVKNETIDYFKIPSFSKKIHVVPEAYDSNHFNINNIDLNLLSGYGLAFQKYFLYVGRIVQTKNLENIIKSFNIFRQKTNNKKIKLVLAGQIQDKKYYNKLKKLVINEQISQNILFLNYVPYNHLPALYNGAILFIFPSYYEGFGLPILEAMACGCPVITSNIYSMPEVANDAGILVNPENINKIAEYMCLLHKKPGFRSKFSELGFKNIQKFSWEKSAKQILNIFKSLVIN